MANDNWYPGRGGLVPYGKINHVGYYQLTTSATAAVFRGQPMDLDSNGRVVPAPTADGSFILGPVLGFLSATTGEVKGGLPSNLTDLSQEAYLDANTDAWVAIADDPDQLFEIQCDTGGTDLAQTHIGNQCKPVPLSTAVSGSTVTGWSSFGLDQSDAAADTGGALQVVAISDRMNSDGSRNTVSAENVKAIVRISQHRLGGGGIGYPI